MVCALIPATGLSALLPVANADASTMIAVALVGGLAAPFILASVAFAGLCVYTLMNALTVEISGSKIRTERRLFDRLVRVREIACADIAEVQPRISARFQNVFSPTPRYALVAKHRADRTCDVIIAEDLIGQTVMTELHALICSAIRKNIV